MVADIGVLLPGIASLIVVGVMGSFFIHILDRNTTPGYINKRAKRKADVQNNKN